MHILGQRNLRPRDVYEKSDRINYRTELISAQSALPAHLVCRVDVLFFSDEKGQEMADSGRMRQVDAVGAVARSLGELVVRQESDRP